MQKIRLRRFRPEAGGFHSGATQYQIHEWPDGERLPQGAEAVDPSTQTTPPGQWIDEQVHAPAPADATSPENVTEEAH